MELISERERRAIVERLKKAAMNGDAAAAAVLLNHKEMSDTRKAVREMTRTAALHPAREFRG